MYFAIIEIRNSYGFKEHVRHGAPNVSMDAAIKKVVKKRNGYVTDEKNMCVATVDNGVVKRNYLELFRP